MFASEKAVALENSTSARVKQLEAHIGELQSAYQAVAADRDKRHRQLESLIASTADWERRVEASDAEYQEMSAALAAEKHKTSQLRSEVLALNAQSGRHIAALKAYSESDRVYRSHGAHGTEPRSLSRFN